MKLRHILSVAAAAFVIGSSGTLHAQEAESEKTPLSLKMKTMNTAYKAMGRAITSGDAPVALKQATIVLQSAEASLKYEPARKAMVPAGEQAKFVADYQSTMKELIGDVKKIEAALKAGDMVEAKALNATIKKDQTDAHKQFRKAPAKG